MLRSMYSGISGLKANQQKLDVIGNNIANVGTTSFKVQRMRFQDVLSQNIGEGSSPSRNLGGTNPTQVGLGVQVAGIDTVTTQGNVQTTGRNLDAMIDGSGFFLVARGANPDTNEDGVNVGGNAISGGSDLSINYTRDGSFTLDTEGNLLTSNGYRILGYALTDSQTEQGKESIDYSGGYPSINFTNADDPELKAGKTLLPLVIPDSVDGKKMVLPKSGEYSFDTSGIQDGETITLGEDSAGNDILFTKDATSDPNNKQFKDLADLKAQIEDNPDLKYKYSVKISGTKIILTEKNGYESKNGPKFDSSNTTIQGSFKTITPGVEGSSIKSKEQPIPTSGTDDALSVNAGIDNINYSGNLSIVISKDLSTGAEPEATYEGDGKIVVKLGAAPTSGMANTANTAEKIQEKINALSSKDGIDFSQFVVTGKGVWTGRDVNGDPTGGTADTNDVTISINKNRIDEPAKLRVKSFSMDKNGLVKAVLEDNTVSALGQVAMASFKNDAGLKKIGKNMYEKSPNSGDAIIRSGVGAENPNEEGYGDLLQGSLEMSNVDLAEQFTDMIVASRAFQANGKIITTGDEILQELVNLKR